ncbi:DUF1120 domain-containing protein [Pectobacterium odoriferum]|nr:DUF1120 domain-containing protein [Pectobacterium odoriferum]MBA0189799.1 DUF1120 domain-containing protein [Pectobacterium odoriferum]MCA6963030.1 DUF1120 domain-containing protein [Pectobacterium odoriferum]MCH5011119.1 DUF1120 domain-containing protein [Pectobacterium odoriferum]POD89857.1 hypothetical protein BV925_20250 [Pectobacterium odoriferum]POE02088.1 hypothetical protein BV916_16735 [Pectobacterium odoriferum]
MMNKVTKTACALAVLTATSTSAMAESIDIKVIGTIPPAACKPALTGGGIIDYGVIPAESLKKDTPTALEEKQVDFSITCDAHTRVAVRAIGLKADTATNTLKSQAGAYGAFEGQIFNIKKNVNVTGLGTSDDGKNIGGYGIRLVPDSYTIDGRSSALLVRKNSSEKWNANIFDNGSMLSYSDKDHQITWTEKGYTGTPIAFKAVAGKLAVQAYITQASALDLTKPVKLDGLTTLELLYL